MSRFQIDVRPADALLGASPLEGRFGPPRPSRTAIALSSDGRAIAFTARRDGRQSLYVRSFERAAAEEVPGTDGADGPFFSPDGQWVGFWSAGALRKVSLVGGPAVKLSDAGLPFGATWAEDDRIVFNQRDGIWSVAATGGTPTPLTTLPVENTEVAHVHPQILPGGTHLLFSVLPVSRSGVSPPRAEQSRPGPAMAESWCFCRAGPRRAASRTAWSKWT